jgi:hypothetical protein
LNLRAVIFAITSGIQDKKNATIISFCDMIVALIVSQGLEDGSEKMDLAARELPGFSV